MQTLALTVAIILAGCATTNSPVTATNARLTNFQNKGEEISEREQQCVRQAVNRANDQVAQIDATPDALTASRTQKAKDDRDREVSECRTNADREEAQLSARESAKYKGQAQQARDRAALMMNLTTSRLR